jgi:hypothetical protein
MTWVIRVGASLAVGAALLGCGSGDSTPNTKTGSESSGLWGCETSNTSVVCTAAIATAQRAGGVYVCGATAGGATCPDAVALKNVPGLDALLARSGAASAFAAMPWACLITGKHQFQCVRDVGPSAGTSDGTGGTGDGTGSAPGTGPGGATGDGSGKGGATGDGSKPPAPSTCDPKSWEPYFAALATYEYNAHGVSITFPRGIFDTSAAFTDLAVASASVKSTPGAPSCHDGEWEMRQQSWLDAVQKGCTALNDPILVMCQQAANYAPNTGACNATGTW